MGVRDNKFRQKALMDDPDLDLLTKSGISNEEAKETADVMTSGGTFAGMVRKVAEEADASTPCRTRGIRLRTLPFLVVSFSCAFR